MNYSFEVPAHSYVGYPVKFRTTIPRVRLELVADHLVEVSFMSPQEYESMGIGIPPSRSVPLGRHTALNDLTRLPYGGSWYLVVGNSQPMVVKVVFSVAERVENTDVTSGP